MIIKQIEGFVKAFVDLLYKFPFIKGKHMIVGGLVESIAMVCHVRIFRQAAIDFAVLPGIICMEQYRDVAVMTRGS